MLKDDGLHNILTFSDKRKKMLDFLQDNPSELSKIREHLRLKSNSEIIPGLNKMMSVNLISRDNGVYSITRLGKVVTSYYRDLVNTIATIESNDDFWKNHDLSPIPDFLLYRLKNLHNCSFVQSAMCNQFEPHKEFTYWVANSTSIKGIVGIFNPAWVPWFTEVSELDIPIELIMTKEVYAKIEHEYSSELAHGLQNKNVHIYVYDGELKVAASTMRTLEGTFFSFGLHFFNGQYDNNLDLQGCDEESFEWGEEFFKYYMEKSEEVLMGRVVSEYTCIPEKEVIY